MKSTTADIARITSPVTLTTSTVPMVFDTPSSVMAPLFIKSLTNPVQNIMHPVNRSIYIALNTNDRISRFLFLKILYLM